MILLALALQVAPPPAPPAAYQPAVATIVAEPVAMMLAAFDSDGDARLTQAEAQAGVARSFAAADPAKSGSIGYIAFADWAERWLGDRNAVPSAFEVDRDGDNSITLAELQDRMGAIFARMDKDKDGVLTRAELLTIRTPVLAPDRRGRSRPPTPPQR